MDNYSKRTITVLGIFYTSLFIIYDNFTLQNDFSIYENDVQSLRAVYLTLSLSTT